ncbi:glycosyltransferase [Cohnella endophytica]|uniref:Glycosyltransferase n=1 Tax=Cohnella endophytica TaxID=2419778 RepID=A0A494XGZ0_9BACL|nr:glycosyltransferase [Cohnella endophytica]RKP47364.1 glycosyltransferase [Cohnella endophytica]
MGEPLLISLCMIVKDEGATLARCLSSVQGAVDETIVVDTGSTDDSAEIAKRYGAVVVREQWKGDFAAARNAGVCLAQGRWILFLDGDEALESSQHAQLRQLATRDDYEGFFLQVRNYVGNGEQGATVNPILRLFRNRPEYRFQGRIHEQIAASILESRPGASFHLTELVIHHYGYQREYIEAKDKVRRNMDLLEAALQAEPDHAFYRYNLGVEYLRSGRPEEALEHFARASRLVDPERTSYAHLLSKYEIRCKQALGRWEEAYVQTAGAIRLYPGYTDLLQYKALCERALGRQAEAIGTLIEAMKQGVPQPIYHTEEGIGTYQTAYLLGELLEEYGHYEEALLAYKKALGYRSSLTPPLYRMFRLLRVAGREKEIPQWLKTSFRLASPEAWAKVVAILLQCRCGRAAAAILQEKQGRKLPEGFRLLAEAEAELQRGRLDAARRGLRSSGRKGQGARDSALASAAIAEHLRWLDGDVKEPWSDRITIALASSSQGSEQPIKLTGDELSGGVWPQLQRLLEGSYSCGKRQEGLHVLHLWQRTLESPEATPAGADALVHGLSAIADRHLALLTSSDFGKRHKEALTAARLRLPHEDGM